MDRRTWRVTKSQTRLKQLSTQRIMYLKLLKELILRALTTYTKGNYMRWRTG